MKKNLIGAALLLSFLLCACGAGSEASETAVEETTAGETAETTEVDADAAETEEAENGAAETAAGADEASAVQLQYGDTIVRVGSLKGPTTMGLVNMMEWSENGELPFKAEFTMATAADEITAKLIQGELDIALIPANLASVLYNRTEGGVRVIDINTLGVLYGITGSLISCRSEV